MLLRALYTVRIPAPRFADFPSVYSTRSTVLFLHGLVVAQPHTSVQLNSILVARTGGA